MNNSIVLLKKMQPFEARQCPKDTYESPHVHQRGITLYYHIARAVHAMCVYVCLCVVCNHAMNIPS